MTEPVPEHRIFIVEDHPLMREVIRDYLGAIPGFVVCGEASSGEDALETLGAAAPDLVLVDTSLARMSGIDFVTRARARWDGVRYLMLSGHGQDSYVERALEAGASGYVLKGDPVELPRAIRYVLEEGRRYLSPRLHMPGEGPDSR